MTNAERRLLIATARGVSILLNLQKISLPEGRHVTRDIRESVDAVRTEHEHPPECPVYDRGFCTCREVVR